MEKGEIAQNKQFHRFPQYFLCNLHLKNPLIATFHLSFAVSLNLGWSQNGVLGNGLKLVVVAFPLALRIMGIELRLARQCQDNGLVKYWLKIVLETWICELSPLNN